MMIKQLPRGQLRLQGQDPLQYMSSSAPPVKRKREDSFDEISASRQQQQGEYGDEDDDDYIFPLQKRSTTTFCTASCDSERRDGPAEAEDDVHDEETEALVKKFRTSIFRQEQQQHNHLRLSQSHYEPQSPTVLSMGSSVRSPWDSPLAHDHDDEEDEGDHHIFDLPSIQRATTICDDSDLSTSDEGCYEPPEMSSRPTSPQEFCQELQDHRSCNDDDRDWSSSYISLNEDEKDPILEARRERPSWILSPTSSVSLGTSQPSPLWNISSSPSSSTKKGSFWPDTWTGTFHQGSS